MAAGRGELCLGAFCSGVSYSRAIIIVAGGIVMSLSVVQIEANLMRLEAEVAEALRQIREIKLARELTLEERRAARLERVRAENERLRPLFDKVFKALGATGAPIGAEKVQEMVAACGVNPEDNLGSRGIIEMREERER
jgi:hypothetical protein